MASAEQRAAKAEARLAKRQLRQEKKFTKTERSWIMYDWANSIYATNIMAAIFPIYFAAVATEQGNRIYGYAISIANLLVAVMAPVLGAIGDFKGKKKKLFVIFLVIGLTFTVVMAVFGSWQMMLIGLVISRIGFSGSCLFYDSFLTDVTKPKRMDRLSAWGYAMGYIGGSTIPFILSIGIVFASTMEPIMAWYNSSFPALASSVPIDILAYKASIMLVVVWWSLFSIPFLKNVKQVYCVDEKPESLAKEAFRNVARTFKDICKDKKILCFIIAYFFYIDGVDTIISLATNYGSTLGLGAISMILALLVTQLVAVPFSILYGNLAKRVGAIKMISCAVVIYFLITVLGFTMGFTLEKESIPYESYIKTVSTQSISEYGDFDSEEDQEAFNKILSLNDEGKSRFERLAIAAMPSEDKATDFGKSVDTVIYAGEEKTPLYSEEVTAAVESIKADVGEKLAGYEREGQYAGALSLANTLFWILATLVGTVQGGIQALSRSFFGQIIPPERSNEYYGFLDIFGKFSCVIGPALYALVLSISGRASFGILSVILLFFAGGIALLCGRKHFKHAIPKDGGETVQPAE